jgi:hypothetical protein
MRMACLGALFTGCGTFLAMVVLVFTTFIAAHPAYLLTQDQELMGYF